MLFGRDRPPVRRDGARGDWAFGASPSTPADPAQGQVWTIDRRTARSEQVGRATCVSVTDMPRGPFAKHPWSIGGGGAAELKETIEGSVAQSTSRERLTESIGIASFTPREMMCTSCAARLAQRRGLCRALSGQWLSMSAIRDWTLSPR